MSHPDRREVLWSLAGLSTIPLWGGCGSSSRGAAGARVSANVPALLRELAQALATSYQGAVLLVRRDQHAVCQVRGEEASLERGQLGQLLLRAGTGQGDVEVATDDLSQKGLERAWELFRSMAAPAAPAAAMSHALDRAPAPKRRLAQLADEDLRRPTRELFDRLSALKSSRLIGRGARIDVIERETTIFAKGLERVRVTQHGRARAEVVAWTGTTPARGAIERGLSGAPLWPTLSQRDIELVQEWALTPLTARIVPAGVSDVILSARAMAVVVGACLAPCLEGARWQAGASALAGRSAPMAAPDFELVDDPAEPGYGTLAVDDDGEPTAPVALISGGALRASLGVDGPARARRRRGDLGRGWRGLPTNLRVRPGSLSADALLADLDTAIAIDGPMAASVDPSTLCFSLRASRGRDVKNGALSGRLYGDLVISGRVDELLLSIRRMSRDVDSVPFGGADAPPWQVSAPAVLTRATITPSFHVDA